METSVDAFGTTKVIGCTGPRKSPTLLGSPPGSLRQVVANTSEAPMSASTGAVVGTVQLCSAPILSQYLNVPVSGVASRIAAGPVHDPCPRYAMLTGGVPDAKIFAISAK